jgi:hypothetical protein
MLVLYLPTPHIHNSFFVASKAIINIWKTSPHKKPRVMTMVIIRMMKKMIRVMRMTK